jgi:hypothetical protein
VNEDNLRNVRRIRINVHVPCEDKGDNVKDSFYEELGRVFDQFPRYDRKLYGGDFFTKLSTEDIFKPTFGNESY